MGELQNEREHVKFYPYVKGGKQSFILAVLKGGHKKGKGSFYMVSFSHIERGGAKKFPLIKMGVGCVKGFIVS